MDAVEDSIILRDYTSALQGAEKVVSSCVFVTQSMDTHVWEQCVCKRALSIGMQATYELALQEHKEPVSRVHGFLSKYFTDFATLPLGMALIWCKLLRNHGHDDNAVSVGRNSIAFFATKGDDTALGTLLEILIIQFLIPMKRFSDARQLLKTWGPHLKSKELFNVEI